MVPPMGPTTVPTVLPIVVPTVGATIVPPEAPTVVLAVVSSVGPEAVPTMVPPHMLNMKIKIDDHREHPGASYHHIQKGWHPFRGWGLYVTVLMHAELVLLCIRTKQRYEAITSGIWLTSGPLGARAKCGLTLPSKLLRPREGVALC